MYMYTILYYLYIHVQYEIFYIQFSDTVRESDVEQYCTVRGHVCLIWFIWRDKACQKKVLD